MVGRPKQCNTCVFSQKSVFVWTAPESHTVFELPDHSVRRGKKGCRVEYCMKLLLIQTEHFLLWKLHFQSNSFLMTFIMQLASDGKRNVSGSSFIHSMEFMG